MKLSLLLIVFLALITAGSCLAVQYTVHDLGMGYAKSINNAGQITGTLKCSDGSEHVFIAVGTQVTDLGIPAGYTSGHGTRINNLGQIVGDLYSGGHWAFIWDASHGFRLISGMSTALGIGDDNGLVAGTGNVSLWRETGSVPTLQGGGLPRDANSLGQVVGNVAAAGGITDAAFWNADGTLVRLPEVASSNFAYSINNLGLVVGESYNGHAWKWSQADGLTRLPNLPGATGATAKDVNDVGQVVGYSTDHPVLWNPDLSTIALAMPQGYTAGYASGINRYGAVVGHGFDSTGQLHALLWTPVPEPSGLFALFAGISGVVILRRVPRR